MTKKHSHLPALEPAQLKAALQRLVASKRLSPQGKRQIAAMLKRAAAGGDSIESAIASLEPGRQAEISGMVAELAGLTTNAVARGSEALLSLDDDEWAELVESAANE